jgi:hypothetical protein
LGPGYFAAAHLHIASSHKDMQAARLRASRQNFFFGPRREIHFQKRMSGAGRGIFKTIPPLNGEENINFL